uniref:Uncharacterized protein n=1 Tax=Oryza punctata TaxID=4537 RepID=A0A0E0K574_ORYPU
MPQRDFATDGWLAASVDRAHYPRGEASTEKRMNMEVTNLTWEIPWIILVDVQLPDELNGKRLLLDFPSKHGVLKWSFELVPDRWARRICRPPRQRPEIR